VRTFSAACLLGLLCCTFPLACSDETSGGGAGGSSSASTTTTSTGTTCELGFLGDPSQEPRVELTVLGLDGKLFSPTDGDTVPLITPPQGGRIVFAGVRATNMSPCSVQLTGSLREVGGVEPEAVRIEARTINLDVGDDGWGSSKESDISTMANIPVCPNQWSEFDVFGHLFKLSVTLEDKEGNTATTSVQVTPACLLEENLQVDGQTPEELLADCNCTCKKGYMLGEVCGAGGGGGGG
jgi:hypothetical protein